MKVIQVFVLVSIYYLLPPLWFGNTWADNKVRELATVCLPWQHWTSVLVWFDEVDISAFHSCVVVVLLLLLLLLLFLIYGSLLLRGIYYCLNVFGVPSRECRSLN